MALCVFTRLAAAVTNILFNGIMPTVNATDLAKNALRAPLYGAKFFEFPFMLFVPSGPAWMKRPSVTVMWFSGRAELLRSALRAGHRARARFPNCAKN